MGASVSRAIALVGLTAVALGCSGATGASQAPRSADGRTPGATPASTVGPTSASSDHAVITVKPGEPWLAFQWFPETIYLVRPDGSDQHPVIDSGPEGLPFAVAWAPNGDELVLVMRGEHSPTPNGSIWTVDVDGTDAKLLYEGDGECDGGAFWPSWSPDGGRLAMVCYNVADEPAWTEVSVLDPETNVRTALTKLRYPETVDNPPSWAPDGSALTFEIITWDPTDQFVEKSVIATVPTTGGEIEILTDPGLMAGHPDWSPDGSLIAFNDYDTGNIHGIEEPSNVWTIRPDGTDLRQLTTASVDGKMRLGQPFWSSDGTRIWVSVARDWDRDRNNQFKNYLAWVDARTGEFHEVGTDGKRFRERPTRPDGAQPDPTP